MNDDRDTTGILTGILILILIALGIFWFWYNSTYETVPNVVGQTVSKAQETIHKSDYEHGDNLKDYMECDFSDIPDMDSADCTMLSWSISLDDTRLTVVKQNPSPGRHRTKDTARMTVTVKPTKEYGQELQVKYQEAQEEEQQRQKELAKYRRQNANDKAARDLNDKISPYNDPLVSEKLQVINNTDYQAVYMNSSSSGSLEKIDLSYDVTKEVLENPSGWYISDYIRDADQANHKVWIAVAAVSSKQTDTATETPTTEPSGKSYYRNCKDVWNTLGHGITSSDPGYSSKLDSDGDGLACEIRPNY